MYLIFSSQSDECAALLYSELRARQSDVLLVDDSLPATELGLSWNPEEGANEGWIRVGDRRVPSGDIEGVVLRFLNPLQPDSDQANHDQHYVLYELTAALEGFLNALAAPVVNRPRPGHSGRHLYSRRNATNLIGLHGLEPVPTWFGTSVSILGEAMKESSGAFVIAGVNAAVPPLLVETPQLRETLADLTKSEPGAQRFVQKIPGGAPVQAYVAGSQVIAVEGLPAMLTVGSNGPPCAMVELPTNVARSARNLVAELGLAFAQVNLVHDEADAWHCLDVMEFPVYSQCDPIAQSHITRAVADVLTLQRVSA